MCPPSGWWVPKCTRGAALESARRDGDGSRGAIRAGGGERAAPDLVRVALPPIAPVVARIRPLPTFQACVRAEGRPHCPVLDSARGRAHVDPRAAESERVTGIDGDRARRIGDPDAGPGKGTRLTGSVLAPVTVLSQTPISPVPGGLPPFQLEPRFRLSALFSLMTSPAWRDRVRPQTGEDRGISAQPRGQGAGLHWIGRGGAPLSSIRASVIWDLAGEAGGADEARRFLVFEGPDGSSGALLGSARAVALLTQ